MPEKDGFDGFTKSSRRSQTFTMSEMSNLTPESVADAAHAVLRLTLSQKEALIDSIHAAQPHILLTMLAISLDSVLMPMLDHALHVLMVIHTAITNENSVVLPVVSREDIRLAIGKHHAMLSYLETEPDRKMWKLIGTSYPEPALLAYVVGYFAKNGVTANTDAQCRVASMSKVVLDLYVDAYQNRGEQSPAAKGPAATG